MSYTNLQFLNSMPTHLEVDKIQLFHLKDSFPIFRCCYPNKLTSLLLKKMPDGKYNNPCVYCGVCPRRHFFLSISGVHFLADIHFSYSSYIWDLNGVYILFLHILEVTYTSFSLLSVSSFSYC